MRIFDIVTESVEEDILDNWEQLDDESKIEVVFEIFEKSFSPLVYVLSEAEIVKGWGSKENFDDLFGMEDDPRHPWVDKNEIPGIKREIATGTPVIHAIRNRNIFSANKFRAKRIYLDPLYSNDFTKIVSRRTQ